MNPHLENPLAFGAPATQTEDASLGMDLPRSSSLPPQTGSLREADASCRRVDSGVWFENEVHIHDSALKAYLAQSFPGVRGAVEDVVQESYLRIWRTRAGTPLNSAKAFLFRVARNIALDLMRRDSISPVRSVGDLAALPVFVDGRGVAETVSMAEKVELLGEALASLTIRARTIVMLRKFQGRSTRETALHLGIAEKTVEEHLYRASKRLGAYLRRRGVSSHFE